MRYEDHVESFEDPQPDRANEERASQKVLFALLIAGAAVAGLYGVGFVSAGAVSGV